VKLLGRDSELLRLDRAWKNAANAPQLVLLTGRRRVGKTALAAEFARRRRSVVLTATREAPAVQLSRFASALQTLGSAIPIPSTFENWFEAMLFAAALAVEDPLLVAIDEVPYLDEADSAFGSTIQAVFDRLLHQNAKPTKLMLLFTGSSRRVMNRLTEAGGPLFGRANLHLRLEPFAFEETSVFLSSLTAEDRFIAYCAAGGYPRHLLAWDSSATVSENLSDLLRPGSMLYDDAPMIVNEEFPSGSGYERILLAIGRGRHSFGEIATEAALRIEGPLSTLEQVGLVEAERSIGGPKRSHPHYVITDPYLRFWFGPVARMQQSIAIGGDPATVVRQEIWNQHLGLTFEREARRHAIRNVAKGILPVAAVGRWWRTGRNQAEFDVVGWIDDGPAFVGEAKWSANERVDLLARRLKLRADEVFGPLDVPILTWCRGSRSSKRTSTNFTLDDMAKP
jgi:uncharacterized protein